MRRLSLLVLVTALLAACGSQSATTVPTAMSVPTSNAMSSSPSPAVTEVATSPAGSSATEAAPTGEAAAPTAAAPTAVADISGSATLTVMTHDSFNVTESVVKAFEDANKVKVVFRKSGDAGSALNQAILSKGAPLADVFYGTDNTFLSRALEADIFEPYDSPSLSTISTSLQLDPSKRLLPVDYGDVVLNYDKAYLAAHNLTPPQSLKDLTKPEWKSLLVVENPATSSPGLAFLMATIGVFGESSSYTWKDFWRDLRANDVLVSEGWEDAYNTQFSGSSGKGPRPLVVSYATSPAAEVFYSDGKLTEPPTGNVLAGGFRQVEFVGILKGTKQRALAERFVDFMLSKPFQEDVPLQMFVYPSSTQATLPDVFKQFAQTPPQLAPLTPDVIGKGREGWIQGWTQIVLR